MALSEAQPTAATGPVDSPHAKDSAQVAQFVQTLPCDRFHGHQSRLNLPGMPLAKPLTFPPSRQAESRKRPAIDPTDDSSPAKRGAVFGQKLACKKLSDKATLPSRGSAWAAGYDLSSAEDKVVPAKGRALIKTDIAIAVPLGTYGRVAPRCVCARHS